MTVKALISHPIPGDLWLSPAGRDSPIGIMQSIIHQGTELSVAPKATALLHRLPGPCGPQQMLEPQSLLSAWQPGQSPVAWGSGRENQYLPTIPHFEAQGQWSYHVTLGNGLASAGQRGWLAALAPLGPSWLPQVRRRSISFHTCNQPGSLAGGLQAGGLADPNADHFPFFLSVCFKM